MYAMSEFRDQIAQYRAAIEEFLQGQFCEDLPQKRLFDAMRYSLLAGGKRIRPVLTLEFCRICGGDWRGALPFACALEMIHTYSLIHDDLPCMDNDDYRRGRLTNHKVFGEALAVLAGDGLLTAAFETAASAATDPAVTVKAIRILAEQAGELGMVGGQVLDMDAEEQELTEQGIYDIQCRKTGALIQAACQIGVVAASGTQQQLDAAKTYAQNLGLAFQIRDDMLDVIGDEATFGKPIGSDKAEKKTTFVDLLGLAECEREVVRLTDEAISALGPFGGEADFLAALSHSMETRNK
jgi:geranylgeranyl diphosphate synthase type II